jgi:hypothetical protein
VTRARFAGRWPLLLCRRPPLTNALLLGVNLIAPREQANLWSQRCPTGSHPDRMPVLLDKADIEPWLNGTGGTELLRPAADDRLRMWPVSRRVNKTGTGNDDPTLVDEVAA